MIEIRRDAQAFSIVSDLFVIFFRLYLFKLFTDRR